MPLLVWIYNSNTGVVEEVPSGVADIELPLGLGWHGPFNTHDDAINFYNLGKAANPGWKAPLSPVPGNVGTAVDNAATSAGQNIASSWLGTNIETLFIRVGEVLLGLVLIAVGVASLTGTTNFISKAVRSKI